MLNISEQQCNDLQRVDVGGGMLKAGVTFVPFRDKFPKDSYLYKMMSTDFNEKIAEKLAKNKV
jgi:hypothetical protein